MSWCCKVKFLKSYRDIGKLQIYTFGILLNFSNMQSNTCWSYKVQDVQILIPTAKTALVMGFDYKRSNLFLERWPKFITTIFCRIPISWYCFTFYHSKYILKTFGNFQRKQRNSENTIENTTRFDDIFS